MAMERLCVLLRPFAEQDLLTDALNPLRRAQIMQQDPSGVYRVTNSLNATGQAALSSGSPTSPVSAGLVTPSTWTLSSSEASAQDHYGHPDGYPVGHIFDSR
jgi:E3 ubiquitin-protein ligase UHRF1